MTITGLNPYKNLESTHVPTSAGNKKRTNFQKFVCNISRGKLCAPPPLSEKVISYIDHFKKAKLYGRTIEPIQPQHNEALGSLRDFMHEMVSLTVDRVYIKHVEPHVRTFNESTEKLPDQVKMIAAEAISIGTRAAKPIFDFINQFEMSGLAQEKMNKVLAWALKERKEETQKDLIKRISESSPQPQDKQLVELCVPKVVEWLYDTDHSQNLESLFTHELKKPSVELLNLFKLHAEQILREKKEDFKNKLLILSKRNFVPEGAEQANIDQRLANCSDKILDWLFNSNHKKSPQDLFRNEPNPPSENLISCVMQSALQILANEKIDVCKDKAHLILQNKIPSIVENSIKENATTLTGLITGNLLKIIENIGDEQYKVLFDEIIKTTGSYLTKIADSEAAAKQAIHDHEALKAYAIKITSRLPKNPKEEKIHKACENYLKNLKNKGGIEAIQEGLMLKAFLALSGNEAPSLSNNISENISKLILETILPAVTKDGKEISGLENLLSNIKLPEEFQALIREAKEIAEMIITPEQFKELHELTDATKEFKELGLKCCSELITMGLNEAIEIVIKQMSKPEEINLMVTNNVLPSSIDSMIRLFADEVICANVRELAPHFHSLPHGEEEKKLIKIIFEKVKREAPLFNFTKDNELSFAEIIKPRLHEIRDLLQRIKKRNPKKGDLKSTIAIIKEYYKSNPKTNENNPYFADFIDVALRTGEFGSVLPRFFSLEGVRQRMSRLITQSVQKYRQSYEPGLALAVPLLRDTYLKSDVVDRWITHQPSLGSLSSDIASSITKIETLETEQKKGPLSIEKAKELEDLKTNLKTKTDKRKLLLDGQEAHKNKLAEAKNTLPGRVDKLARLSHDWMMYKAKNPIGKFFLKRIVGSTADKISRVILTLYNQAVGFPACTEYLISKTFFTLVMGANITKDGSKPLLKVDNQIELSRYQIPISQEAMDAKSFKVEIERPIITTPLWKRVAQFVLSKIKAFFHWFVPQRMNLSNKQRALMNSIKPIKGREKNKKISATAPSSPSKRRNKQAVTQSVAKQEVVQEQQSAMVEESELSPTLKKVGLFVSGFMKKIGDETYKQKITPLTSYVKDNAHKLPNQIHQLLELAGKVIAPLTPTILRKLIQKGYRYDLALDEPVQVFLDVLFKNLKDSQGVVKTNDIVSLKETLRQIKNDEDYIEPTIRWITQSYGNSKEIKPLGDFINDYKKEKPHLVYDDFTVSSLHASAIQWLVTYKIEHHTGSLKDFLETKFSDLIKVHLEKNIQDLSKLIFNRMASLVNKISDEEYKALFDECANDMNIQMTNLIAAEEKVKTLGAQTEAQKKQAIAAELTSEEGFVPKYKLHDLAKSLLRPPANITSETDKEAYKEKEENKVFLKLAERMLNLVLPSSVINADGQLQEINPFQELTKKLYISSEITSAIDEFRQFIKPLLGDYADNLETVEVQVKKLTEQFVLNVLQKYTTTLIADKLKESFKMVSDTQNRKKLLEENFPVIQKQLVRSFASLILSQNYEATFKKMIEGEVVYQTKEKLSQDIWELCVKNFVHSWNDLNISREVFDREYLPEIKKGLIRQTLKNFICNSSQFKNRYNDLINLVRNRNDENARANICNLLYENFKDKNWNSVTYKNGFNTFLNPLLDSILQELEVKRSSLQRANPQAELSHEDVKITLEHYFKGENDGNGQYVTMLTNVIKMGNFGGNLNKILLFIADTNKAKEILTGAFVPALHPIRASLSNVIELTLEGLNSKYLNDEYVRSLVNPKTLPGLEQKKARILSEIATLGKLNDDLRNGSNQDQIRVNEAKIVDKDRKIKKIEDEMRTLQIYLDKEPERQAETSRKFDQGLSTMSKMLYDLINYSVNHASNSRIVNWAVNIGHGVVNPSPEYMLQVIQTFHHKFFNYPELNEALLVGATEKALTLVEKKKTSR